MQSISAVRASDFQLMVLGLSTRLVTFLMARNVSAFVFSGEIASYLLQKIG